VQKRPAITGTWPTIAYNVQGFVQLWNFITVSPVQKLIKDI